MSEKSLNIKIGCVGCGEIVRTRHLPALLKVPSCDVTGVADIDSTKLDLLKDSYPTATRYSRNDDLIASTQIDVVAVCGPPGMHSQARRLQPYKPGSMFLSRNLWPCRSKSAKRSAGQRN